MSNDRDELDDGAISPIRRSLLGACGLVLGGAALTPVAVAQTKEDIVRTGESIHHEIVVHADRQRVYRTLTEGPRFDQLMKFIPETQGASPPALPPSEIGAAPGTSFSLFGGQIVGWQLALIPDELLVQAWRSNGWTRGDYSIARFALSAHAGGTLIAFDHEGFPRGYADSLAAGWKAHYWQPLIQFFA